MVSRARSRQCALLLVAPFSFHSPSSRGRINNASRTLRSRLPLSVPGPSQASWQPGVTQRLTIHFYSLTLTLTLTLTSASASASLPGIHKSSAVRRSGISSLTTQHLHFSLVKISSSTRSSDWQVLLVAVNRGLTRRVRCHHGLHRRPARSRPDPFHPSRTSKLRIRSSKLRPVPPPARAT